MDDQNYIVTLIDHRIRSVRDATGLTQARLAMLHGCSHNKIHNIEVGMVRLTVAEVIELGRHLVTSPLFLLQEVIEETDLAGLFRALASERDRVAVDASAMQQRLEHLDAQIAAVLEAIYLHERATP